jgi:hypothetical protein
VYGETNISATIEVYNMQGIPAESVTWTGEKRQHLSLTGKPGGIYLVKISGSGGPFLFKLIKQ